VKIYVASKSSNVRFALQSDNIIEQIITGIDPVGDAKSYAYDHTRSTDEPAFVYEVELRCLGAYKTKKEIVFGPAQ